ncbi:unnamed protein product [Knipowitschia caucasica]
MACSSAAKPFSPEEAQSLVQQLQQPAVFSDMASDWPVLQWNVQHLSKCLQQKLVKFRMGRREQTQTPLFETQCTFVNATMGEFMRWAEDGERGEDIGLLAKFPKAEYWAYADYKYIKEVFKRRPHMFEDVQWCDFGFEGRGGKESTLWVGTAGANTPCHLDSYGCNLVLQVQGRKRWHLFPPEDSSRLYPTRIPYEESSIFSQVDVLNPDLRRFGDFRGARAHTVTLQPGQVLFVPRHWWHYVESLSPVTVSVNSWIELAEDDEARVSEAVTRAVVCALKSAPSDDNQDEWINPTEIRASSHVQNMRFLNLALTSVSQRRSPSPRSLSPLGRPIKRSHGGQNLPPSPPFGPHLTPVLCGPPPDAKATATATCTCGRKALEPGLRVNPEMVRPLRALKSMSVVDYKREGEDVEAGSGGGEGATGATVSTNDLLDVLVHPDIIKHVTEMLIQRHSGGKRTELD